MDIVYISLGFRLIGIRSKISKDIISIFVWFIIVYRINKALSLFRWFILRRYSRTPCWRYSSSAVSPCPVPPTGSCTCTSRRYVKSYITCLQYFTLSTKIAVPGYQYTHHCNQSQSILSPTFTIEIPQGSILSPIIFSILISIVF